MTELPHLHGADFGAFFEGIHGFAPFPWQARLAAHLGEGGAWPEVLDLPTGTGKTAAIDLAVFQLALEAGRPERAAPLRIVYVVDRRTIVDQAHDRAVTIARAIAEGATPVLQAVRARLASYGRDGQPLRTALLRGGIARSDLWARSPDQPLVAVSTVDQVGSRLLFRGYGVSDSMKPVHAGLLGNDALYLLDEVHLSQPFRETLASVHGRYRGWSARPLPTPFCVVEMSATSGASRERTFELDQDDEAHPLLAKRLQASKPTTLIESTARAFQADVEKQVKGLASRPGATVAVVVNRVAAARELRDRLSRSLDGAAVHLLTGRMRPVDRDALERGVLDRIRAGRVRRADEQPVVIVATQCIEAGADFDFDGLVTECASLDALRQRFGRLDRLGECTEGARATVIAQKDTLSDDPVYGEALGETWRWLSRLAAAGPLDFGLRAMTLPVAPEDTPLLAPRPSAPVMLPSHLDAWVQTSPKPTPDPDVALWLHGPRSGPADVQVVWRADLVAGTLARALDDEGARAVCLGAVQALPPVSREAMSVPFAAAKRWLDGRSEPTITDVEGARQDIAQDEWRERDGEARAAIVWRGDRSEIVSASELRPGDTIVVPATYGGIAHGTWSPAATEPVSDVAELAILRQRGRAVLRLHEDIVSRLFGVSWDTNGIAPEDPQSTESLDDRAQVSEWLAQLPDAERSSEAAALLQILRESSDRRSFGWSDCHADRWRLPESTS